MCTVDPTKVGFHAEVAMARRAFIERLSMDSGVRRNDGFTSNGIN
jgi:hypothetical protein